MRVFLWVLMLIGIAGVAHAQTRAIEYYQTPSLTAAVPVTTDTPLPVTIPGGVITIGTSVNVLTQTGGTVTTGNTFQTVLAANANRKSCLLQNTSTHVGFVFFGTLGSATLTNGFQISPGGTVSCGSVNGPVSQQAVNFTTSTTTDPWVVSEGQ